MHSVISSNLSSIGYEDGNLIVKFHNGGLYRYYDVPVGIYNDLMGAPSKGQYLHYKIKGRYRYSRI